MRASLSRRAVLLGTAGTLAGCGVFDGVFGGEDRLPGERLPVLTTSSGEGLQADAGLQGRSMTLPAPQPREEWPQAGGAPSHAPGHPALGAPLQEAWRSSFGTGSGYRRRMTAPPIVAGGSVYVVDAYGRLSAFDAATGGRRWRVDTNPEEERDGAVGGGVAFDGGTLYVATSLAELLAVDPADGSVRWRVRTPAPTRGAPTVAGGRILVPTIENQLIAFSTDDGRRLWTHRAQPVTTVPLGMPAPAVEGEVVVGGFASGELAALRATDGRVLWSETLAPAGRGSLAEIAGIRARPVISEGRVIAIGLGGLAIVVDLRSGRRLWEREVAGSESPWAVGDWVFLLSDTAELAAIGRDDGRVLWVTSLRPQEGRRRDEDSIWGAPVLAGGRLLMAGGRGELLTIDPATGEIAGRQRLPGGVSLQPAVAGNMLFVATNDATLVALRPAG